MGKTVKKISVIIVVMIIVTVATIGLLFYYGRLWLISPSHEQYPVRGIDVSEHQGDIDWTAASGDGVDFAFIKATEGMDHRDHRFLENWEDAGDVGIVRGAYHFFTFRSKGLDQARNFIAVVPDEEGCLPPTIDIEFGGNSRDVPTRDVFQDELRDFIEEIKRYYGKAPILYVTYESYERFITGDFEDCTIWIRDLLHTPRLAGDRHWYFWQYNPRGRVEGIGGYVDLNIFNGDESEFEEFLRRPHPLDMDLAKKMLA